MNIKVQSSIYYVCIHKLWCLITKPGNSLCGNCTKPGAQGGVAALARVSKGRKNQDLVSFIQRFLDLELIIWFFFTSAYMKAFKSFDPISMNLFKIETLYYDFKLARTLNHTIYAECEWFKQHSSQANTVRVNSTCHILIV